VPSLITCVNFQRTQRENSAKDKKSTPNTTGLHSAPEKLYLAVDFSWSFPRKEANKCTTNVSREFCYESMVLRPLEPVLKGSINDARRSCPGPVLALRYAAIRERTQPRIQPFGQSRILPERLARAQVGQPQQIGEG